MTTYTPMMQQYIDIKRENEDAFLFFRLGDFYELFFEDALRASSILEITLTSREAAAGKERIPMCGVPFHSAEGYIETLVQKGFKVAICEQTEDPRQAKGLVRREVVRVVTPGTLLEGKSIDTHTNHFIGALDAIDETTLAFAYVDVATGEGTVERVNYDPLAIANVANALNMRELVIVDERLMALKEALSQRSITLSTVDAETAITRQESLTEHLPTSLQGAVDLLLAYVQETQKTSLAHIQPFTLIDGEETLSIDSNSLRNLELVQSIRSGKKEGTLYELLDETTTAMGARKLKMWIYKPLANREAISRRLDLVESLIEQFFAKEELEQLLKNVYDLERLAGRISMGSASGRDLAQLRDSLEHVPSIIAVLNETEDERLQRFGEAIDPCEVMYDQLSRAIAPTPPISVKEAGVIADGFHEKLDELRDASRNGKKWLAELEREERERTGIKNLKIGYNRVFGYYIEVTKSNVPLVDETRYERKQTLANSERYITDELKEKEYLILNAEEQALDLEYELFTKVRDAAKMHIESVQQLASTLSELDVLLAFAKVSEQYNYVRPSFHEGRSIVIREGRHPVVEQMMETSLYVPNDCELTDASNMLLITGPNMSGKSTYMRQVALTVVMAQIGCYVPCDEAKLPLTDQIFTRIGAADDVASGQSTFMMEMLESEYAIRHATKKSLLLFDEIGRGTSTYDGMSLAQAMMEYIHDEIGANTLFSTHYHELTSLDESLPRLRNVHVAAKEEDGRVTFLHKVLEGSADRSYGIHVARLAQLPEPILARAEQLLEQFEQSATERHDRPIVEQSREEEVVVVAEPMEQLSFFEEPSDERQERKEPIESTVERALAEADLLQTTPLEALHLLAHLQSELKRS